MSSVLPLPFIYRIGPNAQCPFPGAYIIVGSTGSNSLVPIYTSMPNFTGTGLSEFLNDKAAQVLVLPGYSLELYPESFQGGTYTPFDNRAGTDVMYRNASLSASSCKLSYNFRSGMNEIKSNLSFVEVTVTTSPSITPSNTVYESINYKLYSFTTVGTNTFNITSATDVSGLVLLVAGGGAGGIAFTGGESGGGGGAGGVAIGTIHIPKNVTFNCDVGTGGTGGGYGVDSTLTNASNSQKVTVKGGGGGASNVGATTTGGNGGSGGGGCAGSSRGIYNGEAITGTSTIAGITNYYGNRGGDAYGGAGDKLGGGGGGGATVAGGHYAGANGGIGGTGGAGYTWPVNNVAYAGGGGGGSGMNTSSASSGGSGGGGNGGVLNIIDPTSGTPNTGGGGGGAQTRSSFVTAGGSGIIIIAIPQYAFIT
jgi:hypothetical protein